MRVHSPWRSAARTHVGKVRARNEDAFLEGLEQGLWAVADGMGGHRAGDVASRLIADSLGELPIEGGFGKRLQRLSQCLQWLNRRFHHELTATPEQPDPTMGSTVVALLLEGNRAACVWAGDSRCYLWRARQLYQLSKDHTRLRQLMDEHQMSREQASQDPLAHALVRAVGADEHLELETLELQTEPGDVFLLCSDGFYQCVSTQAVAYALSQPSPQVALDLLFDSALRGPASDNLTAVVIRL